jgi:TolB-like protein
VSQRVSRRFAPLLVVALLLATGPVGARAAGAGAVTVLVAPFAVVGKVDPQAGIDLSRRLSEELQREDGVAPIVPSANAAPESLREVAQHMGADYYLVGTVAPVVAAVSVILQLVRTQSGIVAWSNTIVLGRFDEIAGQAALVHDAVLRAAAESHTNAPAPRDVAATPPVAARIAAAKLAADSPARPQPFPEIDRSVEDPPSPTPVVVIPLGGPAASTMRAYATTALARALGEPDAPARVASEPASRSLLVWGEELCRESSAKLLVAGTLSVESPAVGTSNAQLTTARLRTATYRCADGRFVSQPAMTRSSLVWTSAIAALVADVTSPVFAAGVR